MRFSFFHVSSSSPFFFFYFFVSLFPSRERGWPPREKGAHTHTYSVHPPSTRFRRRGASFLSLSLSPLTLWLWWLCVRCPPPPRYAGSSSRWFLVCIIYVWRHPREACACASARAAITLFTHTHTSHRPPHEHLDSHLCLNAHNCILCVCVCFARLIVSLLIIIKLCLLYCCVYRSCYTTINIARGNYCVSAARG